jgi:hypothetical protein
MFLRTRTVKPADTDVCAQLEKYRSAILEKIHSYHYFLLRQQNEMYGEDLFQDIDSESNPRITQHELSYHSALKINVLLDAVKFLYEQTAQLKAGTISADCMNVPDSKEIGTSIKQASEAVADLRVGNFMAEIKRLYLDGAREAAHLKANLTAPPRP